MNNSGKFGTYQLVRDIANALLSKKPEKKRWSLGPDTIGAAVAVPTILGTYAKNAFYFRFVERADGLYLERAGHNAVKIEREVGNVFHEVADPAFRQVFTRDAEGLWQVTAYYPTYNAYSLSRLDTDFSDYQFTKLGGEYYSEELAVSVRLRYLKDNVYQYQTDKDKKEIELIVPDLLNFNGMLSGCKGPPRGR